MESSSCARLRYVTKYRFHLGSTSVPEQPLITDTYYNCQFHTQPSSNDGDPPPVIEVVSVINAVDPRATLLAPQELWETLAETQITPRMPGRYIIIRSETLSRTIRDTVKHYPGQILTGSNIVIREPFPCLMHHVPELECIYKSQDHSNDSDHLGLLLDFLRPRFEHHYQPVRNNLSSSQPTVRFDDLWILMIPGSLAYAQVNGEWLGCIIHSVEKLPCNESGCATSTISINQFDGEELITALPIYPSTVYDAKDAGTRRQQLVNRGTKVRDVMWGSSKYMCYDGKSLDRSGEHFVGRILVGGAYPTEEQYVNHDWTFDWMSPEKALQWNSEVHLKGFDDMLDPKTQSQHFLGEGQLLLLSPSLSAFRLSNNQWVLIHINNVRPLEIPTHHPAPCLSDDRLASLMSLMTMSYNTGPRTTGEDKRAVILLHGPPGAGKSHTIEYASTETCRPLIMLREGDITSPSGHIDCSFQKWISFAEKYKALLMIDNCDAILLSERFHEDRERRNVEFCKMLEDFSGTLLLTTNRVGTLDEKILSRIDLKILFPPLQVATRKQIWETLESNLQNDQGKVHLRTASKTFLYSSVDEIDFNSHEITQCFKTAKALATMDAHEKSNDGGGTIFIEVDHFKKAMNWIHDFRNYHEFTTGSSPERRAFMSGWRGDNFETAKHKPSENSHQTTDVATTNATPSASHLQYSVPMIAPWAPTGSQPRPMWYPAGGTDAYGLKPNMENRYPINFVVRPIGTFQKPATSSGPMVLNHDASMCVSNLNFVEWDDFQAAGKTTSLFRKNKFYAIDCLIGEPQIMMQTENKERYRVRRSAQENKSQEPNAKAAVPTQNQRYHGGTTSTQPLPERIRINSPGIVKAFSVIHEEPAPGPFLMFRPYLALLHYEQDFRELVAEQEKSVEEHTSMDLAAKPGDTNAGEDSADDSKMAGLQEVKCLLSFIDDYVKPQRKYIMSSLCKAITFPDLAFLFTPGDAVIASDEKQAYRVVRVVNDRHRVKNQNEIDSKLLADDNKAQFANNPFYIYCVHVDFDGTLIGPVLSMFKISRFDGEREVTTFPIYPFRYARDHEARDKLIDRGRTFVDVANIKHMHYAGWTLGVREEIDGPVEIDFEEAIDRHPTWKPLIQALTDMDENMAQRMRESGKDVQGTGNSAHPANASSSGTCVKECCLDEVTHHDEYVQERQRREYIDTQLEDRAFKSPPVSIAPRAIKDFNDTNPLTGDEFLIMSSRVLGFALRNRKWFQLDMSNMSEVTVLGKGEGFDQLVLPDGHGELVKSMIKQHFRDKKSLPGNPAESDVVRGKGRGLIMLLHGVPGVGKTSTAECIADLFRRPLLQITSGDLGTSAKDVEDTLNENFNLASRWNSILLIDEADVFLGERTKEDFVRNSLVAVFLRMMEYYSGVLFLTTNRVGVFDEAFSSRIHISLYYPPLDRDSTLKIFEKNWERIQTRYTENGAKVNIKVSEITKFALEYFDKNKEGRWNGRQIRNAFQSALALAELDACPTDDPLAELAHSQPVILGRKSFDAVAKVYENFLAYLKQVHGADFGRRARENHWRSDTFGAPKIPNALTNRLAMPDLAPPPRGAENLGANQPQAQYTSREPPRTYHPPQKYSEHYGYRDPGPWYPPPPEQYQYREPPRGMAHYPSETTHVPSMGPDSRSEVYNDPRTFVSPAATPGWSSQGGREATSRVHQPPPPHEYGPGHSQIDQPAAGLSPFPRTD